MWSPFKAIQAWRRIPIEFTRIPKKAWGIRVHSRWRVRLRAATVCGGRPLAPRRPSSSQACSMGAMSGLSDGQGRKGMLFAWASRQGKPREGRWRRRGGKGQEEGRWTRFHSGEKGGEAGEGGSGCTPALQIYDHLLGMCGIAWGRCTHIMGVSRTKTLSADSVSILFWVCEEGVEFTYFDCLGKRLWRDCNVHIPASCFPLSKFPGAVPSPIFIKLWHLRECRHSF